MTSIMEQVRAKLLEKQNKKSGDRAPRTGGDNASYPFWNIPEGSSATLRFLPDGDTSNTLFWVPRETIKLPFAGVVGGDYPTDRDTEVTVPCIDMFGMSCPIIAATKPWWKDDAKKDLARKYWKKKSYIMQGFVVNSPFEEQNVPENPIRRFTVNPSVYEIIEKSLINPEMEDMPCDYTAGRDFKIAKTKKGEYANYSTSNWSFKTRSLSEAEMSAIATHGLFDLKEYQGRRPDADEVEAIKAMFEASLAGDPFDMAAFGQYYRPYSNRGDNDTPRAPRAQTQAAAPAETSSYTPAPAVTETASAPAAAPSGKSDPQAILERIRARTGK